MGILRLYFLIGVRVDHRIGDAFLYLPNERITFLKPLSNDASNVSINSKKAVKSFVSKAANNS